MEKWPLNLQIKDKVVHKIRPCSWYSQSKQVQFLPFNTLEEYISAIDETVYQNPKTKEESGEWLVNLKKSYHEHYGVELDIPRWRDIKETFLRK